MPRTQNQSLPSRPSSSTSSLNNNNNNNTTTTRLSVSSHHQKNNNNITQSQTQTIPPSSSSSFSSSLSSSNKTRQLSHLNAQLAQLAAHSADLDNLLRMTSVQAESIRGLGGYAGAMWAMLCFIFPLLYLNCESPCFKFSVSQYVYFSIIIIIIIKILIILIYGIGSWPQAKS